ncbi:Uncharacterised protein [Mycobacterium tuberculosis]|nr:Uncharacterised protein [Mycobacterium tuberculosis]
MAGTAASARCTTEDNDDVNPARCAPNPSNGARVAATDVAPE